MKVNDLKALFEKSGTIKNQPPPGSIYGNPIKHPNTNNKTITIQPQQHQKIHIEDTHPVQMSKSQVREQEPHRLGIKNNDFLNQLNKKLTNKTIKPKYYQNQSNTQEVVVQQTIVVQQVPIPKPPIIENKKEEVQTNKPQITQHIQVPKTQDRKIQEILAVEQSRPQVVFQQQQLDFDGIINGNLLRSRLQRSGNKARYGINERHPTTQQDELLFEEWEEQRKSQEQSSKKLAKENIQAISYLRIKPSKPKEIKSLYYSKIPKDNKIKRIQRIVDFIFAKSSFEAIENPRLTKTEVNYNLMKLAIQENTMNSVSQQVTVMPMHLQSPNPLLSQQIKIEQPTSKIISQRSSIGITESRKGQVSMKNEETQQQQQQRPMFNMNKQMLNQINSKIKKRESIIQQANVIQNSEMQREKSPINKKKRHFQNFDDS